MVVSQGQFLGLAGRGLDNADWAINEQVALKGQEAEMRTGRVLYDLTKRGPTVINDLRIPIPGFTANIDHVVIYKNRVLIIDTKAWADGFYWTFAGKTRRGLEPIPHADRRGIPTAVTSIRNFLARKGIDAKVVRPALVIWTNGSAHFFGYRPAGSPRVVHGGRLHSWLDRNVPSAQGDHKVMLALAELAN